MANPTVYTTQATQQVQAKAIADAGRLIIDYTIGTVWQELPSDVQERLYGVLEQ